MITVLRASPTHHYQAPLKLWPNGAIQIYYYYYCSRSRCLLSISQTSSIAEEHKNNKNMKHNEQGKMDRNINKSINQSIMNLIIIKYY